MFGHWIILIQASIKLSDLWHPILCESFVCTPCVPLIVALLGSGTSQSGQLARDLQLRQTTVGALLFKSNKSLSNLLVSILSFTFRITGLPGGSGTHRVDLRGAWRAVADLQEGESTLPGPGLQEEGEGALPVPVHPREGLPYNFNLTWYLKEKERQPIEYLCSK